MDRTTRAPGSGEWHDAVGVLGVAVGIPALTEVAGLAVWAAPYLGGPDQGVSLRDPFIPQPGVSLANPFALYHQIFATHELAWSTQASIALAGMGVAACATCVGAAMGWRWLATEKPWQRAGIGRTRREAIDGRARWMGRGKELLDLGRAAMAKKASSLGVQLDDADAPGVAIGRALTSRAWLYASFEDLHLDIMGPRAGKSTSRVVPAIMQAPGAVVATSNKRDVVDATRRHRAEQGRVWVFDPQGVAEETASWYWDPIKWVAGTDDGVRTQERALELAAHFAAGTSDSDKRDAFFDPEGEDLLAGLFLAAAAAERPITDVYLWVTNSRDQEPVDLLQKAGYTMVASGLSNQYNAPEKQRAGIFGTAKKMAACLKLASVAQWVSPGSTKRRAFDVHAFARSRDTLYPLSREGAASAGPLITALAAAVCEAATEEATRCGGRLPVPLLAVLDEAANIVRWRDLPKLYSHFGSRGIIVMTILQSWAQGVRCWGPEGMSALWSAANIRLLGPGLADANFLRDISDLVGDHYERVTSATRSPGHRSTSENRVTERTLTASDLAAIPRGRALLFVSGHRPTLIETVPWMARPQMAAAVRASLAVFDPATRTARNTTTTGARPHLRVVRPGEEGRTA